MLSKTVAIGGKYYSWSVEKYLFVSHRCHVREVKTQIVPRSDVADFTPLALLGFLTIHFKDCSYTKSECSFRH